MAKTTRLTTHWKKAAEGFAQALGYASEHLSGWAKGYLKEATQESLRKIDAVWPHHSEGRVYFDGMTKVLNGAKYGGDQFHPWYSGHLHDSVVGLVSEGNRILSIDHLPSAPAATSAYQTYMGESVVGFDAGERAALNYMGQRILSTYATMAVLLVGVPYADKVNNMRRHLDFEQELSVQFAAEVEDYLLIKADEFRNRVFIADKKK